jgi:hypothetical protein
MREKSMEGVMKWLAVSTNKPRQGYCGESVMLRGETGMEKEPSDNVTRTTGKSKHIEKAKQTKEKHREQKTKPSSS